MTALCEVPRGDRLTETESRMVGAGGWGGDGERVFKGDRASVQKQEESSADGRWCLHNSVNVLMLLNCPLKNG